MKSVKNMKMLSTAVIAAVLTVSAFALPVHAEENTTSASTEFSYVQKNEPTYTVSIPSALALSKEGTALNIEAKDVADLDGKKVTVTIAGTDYYRNQLVLQAKTSKPTYTGTIRYQLIAADGNTIETTGNDTATEFSYVQKNEPTYTVSIPSALALSKEGTALNIEAKDVADLDGKKVTVTIAGTDYYRNQLVLQAKTSKPTYTGTIRYQLIAADGNTIETTGNDTATGTELASFTGNGTVTYTAKPVLDPRMNIEPGVNYTGTMTFGIGLTE